MTKLFFFGDSITAGAWDDRGGWVGRVMGDILSKTKTSTRKTQGFYCMPYNLGVSGDTLADVVRRFEREILSRTYGDSPQDKVQLVFAVGVNDSVYLMDKQKDHAPNDIFEKDLQKLIQMAKKVTDNIAFVSLLPVVEARVMPCSWLPEIGYRNESVERCNAMIRENCLQQNIAFWDVYEEWTELKNLDEYLSDGIHPNNKGHALLQKQMSEFLFTPEFDVFHTKV